MLSPSRPASPVVDTPSSPDLLGDSLSVARLVSESVPDSLSVIPLQLPHQVALPLHSLRVLPEGSVSTRDWCTCANLIYASLSKREIKPFARQGDARLKAYLDQIRPSKRSTYESNSNLACYVFRIFGVSNELLGDCCEAALACVPEEVAFSWVQAYARLLSARHV